mgnify:CR=1 FL=1
MITFFHRNHKCGYSIYKVFKTIESELKSQNQEIEEYFMPSQYSMPWDIIRNSIFTFKHRNTKGINHISGHIHDVTLGLIGCKTILTIHDLVFIDNVKNPLKKIYKWLFWLYIPVKLADKVICISNETKRKVLKHIKTDKITVIYNPIDPTFKYVPKAFNQECPTILHIGTFWNKNLERTIEALEGINCHLRVIGEIDNRILQLLQEKKIQFSNVKGLSDEEIRQEYINCDIVNFPSIYEGFGMPVIEGQQTGRVIITSAIEPIKEIANDGAYFINPYNVDDLRTAYLEIIKNQTLRNDLIEKGLHNVKRFDAKKIATQYIDVYKNINK